MTDHTGPLAGIRIVEMDAIGPVPLAGMMLADMGADVVRIARGEPRGPEAPLIANRSSVVIDLKSADGVAAARDLIARADAVIEGFRPGVMERLGLGPDACLAANPALVFVRMTGWGQAGPLAERAGHDLNYIAITGVLGAIGAGGTAPPPPLNLIGDYGGGAMFAISGILAALLSARATGRGQVVDAAMVDGVATLSSLFHTLSGVGLWSGGRGGNLLDGGAPFYRCYPCADGEFVAVGAIEPQFFALLLAGLGIDGARFAQHDRAGWPALAEAIGGVFATQPRDHWAAVFGDTDACVTPVLSFAEARAHRHVAARGILDGDLPAPAPRFSVTPAERQSRAPVLALEDALARWDQAKR
ncbi:CoA transferase [Sphingomonas donggukensis]|uniref:CoA transferase n=1 Tax=Sphingomonas donggukensis TaxID=2949093 RepID=A0ABY4TUM2_9SPHN|nr:CaiB/BaiF CoA-transferase family protein [Sphingomonas donggukensis]URW76082.1 CoA transferase [Sphingomonas donggukensis]